MPGAWGSEQGMKNTDSGIQNTELSNCGVREGQIKQKQLLDGQEASHGDREAMWRSGG